MVSFSRYSDPRTSYDVDLESILELNRSPIFAPFRKDESRTTRRQRQNTKLVDNTPREYGWIWLQYTLSFMPSMIICRAELARASIQNNHKGAKKCTIPLRTLKYGTYFTLGGRVRRKTTSRMRIDTGHVQ